MNDRVDAARAARGRSSDLPGMLAHVEPLAARKFVIAIRRLANDLTYGLDGSRFLGSGIDYVLPEDLFALAEDVILHRIRLTYEAVAEGFTSQQVLQEILGEVAR